MERDIALVTKDAEGNTVIEYPLTRAEMVEDLATAVAAVKVTNATNADHATSADSATSATTAATATKATTADTATKATSADSATTATTASKLGAATVGGTATPIYLNAGSPTKLSSTVGSASKPVYLNAGVITACGSELGAGGASKIPYATCSTATGTAAKVATVTNGVSFSLVAGAVCVVKFSYALNSDTARLTAPTLNINSTGAKACGLNGGGRAAYGFTYYSSGVLFVYNGTAYIAPTNQLSNYYNDYGDSG